MAVTSRLHSSDGIIPIEIFLKFLALDVAVVAHPEDKIAFVRGGDFPQAIDADARIFGSFLQVEHGLFPNGDLIFSRFSVLVNSFFLCVGCPRHKVGRSYARRFFKSSFASRPYGLSLRL